MEIAKLDILDNEATVKARKSGLEAAAAIYSLKADLPASMLWWLVETRYALVTQPVDKIYGMLGVCKRSQIVPDYSKSMEDLYCEVALHELQDLIQHQYVSQQPTPYPATHFLCCVDHDTDPATAKSVLPSWVPDWSQPRLTTSFAYSTASLSYYPSGETMGLWTYSLSDRTLLYLASPFGCIASLSIEFVDAKLSLDVSENVSLRHCIEFFTELYASTCYGGSGLWKDFCSTLVAGKDHTGLCKSPEDYIEALSFLCDLVSARSQSPTFTDQTYTARQKKPIGRGGLTSNHFSKGRLGRTFQSLKGAYKNAVLHRRLCWTDTGYVALVPRFTRKGDIIFHFLGCVVPFVLRQIEGQSDRYILIGECYMASFVDGSLGKERSPQEYATISIV